MTEGANIYAYGCKGPRSELQIEEAKTFWGKGAKHAENQEQGDFWYDFKYILEITFGGGGGC